MNETINTLTEMTESAMNEFIELATTTLDFGLTVEDCFPAAIYKHIEVNGKSVRIKIEFTEM